MLAPLAASVVSPYVRKRVKGWLERLEASQPLEPITDGRPVSLYLHVPFCDNLCKFCHFVKYPYDERRAKQYFAKLMKDVEEAFSLGYDVKEVYVGGGSPSCYPEGLSDLVDLLWDLWRPEISLEVNPKDVVKKRAIDYLEPTKVKRISMGVQSFDGERLRKLGRPVNPEMTQEAIELIVAKKFHTFNIDIIWDTESIREDAERAFESGANQVTFYPLMPFPERGLKGELKGFKVYEEIVKVAKEKGFCRANAWTFSKGKSMIDEYISECDEFLGLGVSSFSLLNGVSHVNTFSVDKYLKSEKWFPVEHSLKLSHKELKDFKRAYKLHANPSSLGIPGELGWYLGVVVLREMYTILGDYRMEKVSKELPSYVEGMGAPSRAQSVIAR